MASSVLVVIFACAVVHAYPLPKPTPSGPAELATRHQYLKQIRIHTIRKEVIEKLRLPNKLLQVNASAKEIPKVVFRKALEKLKMKDKDLQQTGMIADAYAQISEIVSFSESDMKSPINAIHFRLADDVIDDILEVSEVHVWVLLKYKKYPDRKNPARRVELFVRSMEKNRTGAVVSRLEATVWHTRWQKLSLPPKMAQKLIERRGETLSLVIECHYCDEQLQPVLARKSRQGKKRHRRIKLNKRRPFLIIRTRVKPSLLMLLPPRPTEHDIFKRSAPAPRAADSHHQLSKRSVWVPNEQDLRCNYTNDEKACRLVTMYVNMREQFGELVSQPEGIYMNYCAGQCHGGEECCVPTATLPLTVTYLSPQSRGGTRDATIDDLIITQCGCK